MPQKILKVVIGAPTASFRYPRVQIGSLPTHTVPPPATLYGQMAAAVGDWFNPTGIDFAYTFTYAAKAVDLETFHPIEQGSGRPKFKNRGWDYPVNVECNSNIQRKEFLVQPKLALYLRSEDNSVLERLHSAFICPFYPLLMGRTQDLASCHSINWIMAETKGSAFFSSTILPFAWRPAITPGRTVLLATFTDYADMRSTQFERFVMLEDKLLVVSESSSDVIDRDILPPEFLVDPTESRSDATETIFRGLHFFPLRGGASDASQF
jgi:CRISPR-associated protein Cas5t